MNRPITHPPPATSVAERMLRRVGIKVELPPSQHRLACERKASIEVHLERPGSPLAGLVTLFYQQGSMAIGATIRAKRREDGYDIDIVVELRLPRDMPPAEVLDLLFQTVKGEPGSRYHDMVERQTRCVTIHYADGMHIDLTPSILVQATNPRKSVVFHSKPEEPRHLDRRVPTNSYGFAEEFNDRCPPDFLFAEKYGQLARRLDYGMAVAKGESEDVPPHSSEVGAKSVTVVALQLIKRFRVLRYRNRPGQRMPPSVMLSCLVLEAARPGRTIGEALWGSAAHIERRLRAAHDAGALVDIRNPRDPEDRFTDRWPATLDDQKRFIDDLVWFRGKLAVVLDEESPLHERGEALRVLFGETPGREATEEIWEELAAQGPPGLERKVLPIAPAVAPLAAPRIAPAKPIPTRPHTFFGPGPWRRR